MELLKSFLFKFLKPFEKLMLWYQARIDVVRVTQFAHFEPTSKVSAPTILDCPQKIYLYENTNINQGAAFIISPIGDSGRFIMKKNSGAAINLTVITGNHQRTANHFFKDFSIQHINDEDKDIVVEEDVWIGANVTLLAGIIIGRGATVGAGCVCHKSVPPYAVVMGNPAKVVGFNYTPEEIIEHEKTLYPEEERLSLNLLQKNYDKYFLNRIKEIKEWNKL